jgi:superfamily II DNA or RNA helicase
MNQYEQLRGFTMKTVTTFSLNDFTEAAGDKEPRYYQLNAVNAVADYLEQGYKRIEVLGPTGCGKTITSKLIAMSKRVRAAIGCADKPVLRVLFVSNRHRLNRQAQEEYAHCESVEIIPQSAMSNIPQSVIDQGWDITFIDESHHEAMMSIQLLLKTLINHPIIGFTADNQRNDGMLCKFDRTVLMITEAEAAEKGFIEKVGINTIIDYDSPDKAQLGIDLVKEYGQSMGNTIVFFRTEKEVHKFHRGMLEMGYTSEFLDKTSSEKDLDAALDRLSTGEIKFLVNCQKVGEGIDTPNCTDVMLMRHFNSRAEKKQYIGRAIRNDSPCQAWEIMNPLADNITAKQCVGMVKFERLIYKHKSQWFEEMLSGEDAAWGQMDALRVQPEINANEADEVTLDADVNNAKQGQGALSLKTSGLNTNTFTEKAQEPASLAHWYEQMTGEKPAERLINSGITLTRRSRKAA